MIREISRSAHTLSPSLWERKGSAFQPVLHAAAMASCQEWQRAFAPSLAPEGQKEITCSC